jgi:hypothetical protein
LESLADSLDQYFACLSSEMYDWVRNPFVGFSQNSLSMQEEERVNELQCDRTLKMKFNEVPRDAFWISISKEYPVILAKPVKILLQFSTYDLCEQASSRLTSVFCRGRTASMFVKNSAKNSTFLQKQAEVSQ